MEDKILRDSEKTQQLANDLKKRTHNYNQILTEVSITFKKLIIGYLLFLKYGHAIIFASNWYKVKHQVFAKFDYEALSLHKFGNVA